MVLLSGSAERCPGRTLAPMGIKAGDRRTINPLISAGVQRVLQNYLTADGKTGLILLASCLGDDTGGGLFAYDGNVLEELDRVSTTGLWAWDDHLVRVLWCSSDVASVGELLVYDSRGVERYYRVDALADPHDIIWDDRHFIVVSSCTNSVLWISPSGEVARRWKAPGDGDAWHLNSLLLKDDQLLVCSFGKFRHHRGWVGGAAMGAGVVMNLETGEDLLTGLSCPHHPRYVDGAWVVCNSATSEILQIDPGTGEVLRRLELRAWTRGVAIGDDVLFVGESAHRHKADASATASIAVICRKTWAVLDRVYLPCREVYDLVLARPSLVDGVRRGFRTNPLRVSESDQFSLFSQLGVQPMRLWAVGDPLPAEACRVKVEADIRRSLELDTVVDVECTVENLGPVFLVSAPPNPVRLSYKWLDPSSGCQLPGTEGMRTAFPCSLPPRQKLTCRMKIRTPPLEGVFLLRITLVQESVAWFDDLDDGNHCSRLVHVTSPEGPSTSVRHE